MNTNDPRQPIAQSELELAHNLEEADLMARAAASIGGSALTLFDASRGDAAAITDGTAAYRAEAERLKTIADRTRSIEPQTALIPDIWAESAERVLGAGGLLLRVALPADYRGPSIWTVMRELRGSEQSGES